MASSWEMLRAAVVRDDWSSCVEVLLSELRLDSPYAMLPLLNGAMGEIIKREDETEAQRALKAASRSAFGRRRQQAEQRAEQVWGDAAPAEDAEPAQAVAEEEVQVAPSRRWRQTLRAMFTADGAVALQGELYAMYSSTDFVYEAELLNRRLQDAGMSHEAKKLAVADLKFESVVCTVLPHFGFPATARGLKDVENIIEDLSKKHKEIRKMSGKLNKQILTLFPNIR